MNRSLYLPFLIAATLSMAAVSTFADDMSADWLYLTGQGAWAEQTITVHGYPHDVGIPIDASRIWWAQDGSDRKVTRIRSEAGDTLSTGTRVRINQAYAQHRVSAGTELTVLQVLNSGILLTDGSTAFLIAPENYSILSVPVPNDGVDVLRLESDAEPGSRKVAWFMETLQSEVVYDLDLSDPETGNLQQRVWLRNQSASTITADGFSYQPDRRQSAPFAARRLEAVSAAPTSQASEVTAEYQALIDYPHSITLDAESDTWLPATSVAVKTESDFHFQWRFNAVRNQSAHWRLAIEADAPLPRLAGPVSVSWFDQQRADISSEFRRNTDRTATLNLGQNDQVTLNAERESDDQVWSLTFYNHLDQDVSVELDMTYQVSGMNQPVSRSVRFELPPGSDDRRVRGLPSGIEEL